MGWRSPSSSGKISPLFRLCASNRQCPSSCGCFDRHFCSRLRISMYLCWPTFDEAGWSSKHSTLVYCVWNFHSQSWVCAHPLMISQIDLLPTFESFFPYGQSLEYGLDSSTIIRGCQHFRTSPNVFQRHCTHKCGCAHVVPGHHMDTYADMGPTIQKDVDPFYWRYPVLFCFGTYLVHPTPSLPKYFFAGQLTQLFFRSSTSVQ